MRMRRRVQGLGKGDVLTDDEGFGRVAADPPDRAVAEAKGDSPLLVEVWLGELQHPERPVGEAAPRDIAPWEAAGVASPVHAVPNLLGVLVRGDVADLRGVQVARRAKSRYVALALGQVGGDERGQGVHVVAAPDPKGF